MRRLVLDVNVLIKARTDLGISQKDLAEMTGLVQPAVCRYEKTGDMSLKTLCTVVQALGLEMNDVFVEVD